MQASFEALAGEVFTGQLVALMAAGFDAPKAAATVALTRIVLPAQLCFFLGGLMMGVQNAHGHFWAPALGPVIYNVGIIAGGVFLAPWLGPAGLCWGALGGAVAGNFALQAWAVHRLGGRFRPRFDGRFWRAWPKASAGGGIAWPPGRRPGRTRRRGGAKRSW